jgi:TPR repeat protein
MPNKTSRPIISAFAAAVMALIALTVVYTPRGGAQTSQTSRPPVANEVRTLVQQADRLWDERKYTEALPLYRKAAQAGQGHAMTRVGLVFDEGYGVRQDYSEAVRWYRRGVEAGDLQAMAFLGLMYAAGTGVPVDFPQALLWLHKAADQGDTTGMTQLGFMYANGYGVAKDPADATRWFRKAADLGDIDGMNDLANMYLNGSGIPKSVASAMQLYRKAADLGQTSSMVVLGQVYAKGSLGVSKDPAEARRWLQKAADLGDSIAKESLARFGRPTFDLNGDWEGYFATPAIPQAIRITQVGSKMSAIWIRTDNYAPTSLPFARGIYDGESGTGQVEIAEYNGLLGLLSFLASNGSQSPATSPPTGWGSATLYIEDPDHIHFGNTPAFERISAPRENDLHCNFENPLHVKALFAYVRGIQSVNAKNYKPAVCWFSIGAAQGSAQSTTALGVLLHDGLGVGRNYSNALIWFMRASEVDPNAARALAGMYERGEGTAPDKAKAEFWRAKARDMKNKQEQEALAEKKKDARHKADLANIGAALGGFMNLLGQMDANDACQPEYVKDGMGGYYDANEIERNRRIAAGTLKCVTLP